MPIEVGRWNNTDIDDRKCNLCTTNSVDDEFHYLLECPYFKHDGRRLIPASYFERPNMLKFRNLLCTREVTCLVNLSKFMGLIIKLFSSYYMVIHHMQHQGLPILLLSYDREAPWCFPIYHSSNAHTQSVNAIISLACCLKFRQRCEQMRPWRDCADAQACQDLCCSPT